MNLVSGLVRSASRGLSRLTGRNREEIREEHRSSSNIRNEKAGFGYVDVTEVQETPRKIGVQEKKIAPETIKELGCVVQGKYEKYGLSGIEKSSKDLDSPDQETDRSANQAPPAKVGSSQNIAAIPTKAASKPETQESNQKPSEEVLSKKPIVESCDDEFEVFINLSSIKGTVKTVDDACSVLEKAATFRGWPLEKQPKSAENPTNLKVSFFYLAGSNCLPDDLRIPWYLKIMSSSMIVNPGTAVLSRIRGMNPKSASASQEQILRPLRIKEIKDTWKKYLLCDIPDMVLFTIEKTLRFHEEYKKAAPISSLTLSTLIKFYSLWAMVLYKPLQKSMAAISQSRSMSIKSKLFVDYAGNKVPIGVAGLDGLFEGVWIETTNILNSDKFVEFGTNARTFHAGTVCLGFIEKMIAKQPDAQRKKYQQILSEGRTEIYKVIETLQKNFFFWEESQLTQAVNSGFMLDLFVLLNGKLVAYLVAKIISQTNLDTLKGWAASCTITPRLLEECRKLVVQPNFDQVTELLDFDFIRENIYQSGARC